MIDAKAMLPPRVHAVTHRALLKIALLASASCLAAAPALAQTPQAADPPQQSEENKDVVVVTGSRLQSDGFSEPTPVTVVGEEFVQRELPTSMANLLNTLPSFGTPVSSANPGLGVSGGGLSLLNLRNLGVTRTLVLLDNRRVIPSTPGSGVDINTLPTSLVERVEVVTGGASATWGADAVAGVVNFVLNTEYEGLEVSASAGISDEGDNQSFNTSLTWGSSFAGGRGHVVAAFDYSRQPDIVRAKDRDYWKNWAIVPNPAFTAGSGRPQFITVQNAGPANVSQGGVITSGPLRGTEFIGPNGTPVAYNFGNAAGVLQWGGNVDLATSGMRNLTNALTYGNAFAHAEYDLTDNITAYVEGSFGKSVVNTDSLYYNRGGNLTIFADNAYLDPTIRTRLGQLGQTSFSLGKTIADVPPPGSRNQREVSRIVAGLDGEIGETWKWATYYQRGHVDVDTRTYNNPLVPRFNLATDAVRNTNGQIVCRSTISDPTNGCVPLNVLGNGVTSPEAFAWVFGTVPFQHVELDQDVFGASATGELFNLPAGPVSLAVGGEYTQEEAVSTQDAGSQARQYFTGNFQPFSGERDVQEVFAEVGVPILKDVPFFQALDLSLAARLTDYSTSGEVTTWKAGLSNQVTDDLRLRVTRSRDIRAPTLTELFTRGSTGTQSIFDPQTNRNYFVLANTTGNIALQPEEADTTTAGLIWTPSFLPGFGVSIDYYNIELQDAIASLTAPQTVNLCFNGTPSVCGNIIRDGTGTITQINLQPTNFAFLKTSGWDFEVNYRFDLGEGDLTLRTLVTYLTKLDQSQPDGTTRHAAGAIDDFVGGQPKLKGQFSATYDIGPWSSTAKLRAIGPSKLNNAWEGGIVDDNSVPGIVYFDLRASYDLDAWGSETQLFVAVDNVLDRDPPRVAAVPNTVPYVVVAVGTRLDLFDAIGRSYRVGIRTKF